MTQKIPNWTGYEHYYLALNDTLGAGLDYGSLTSITVGGKALASTFYKENVNGKTISWLFGVNGDILASDASKAALPVGATITVTYKARLNGNAVIGSAIQYDPSVPVNNGEDIAIEFWYWTGAANLFQAVVDEYTAIHPNVKITLVENPYEDYWTKLPLALQARTAPPSSTYTTAIMKT